MTCAARARARRAEHPSSLLATKPFHDVVELLLVKFVEHGLQLRLGNRGDVLGIDLLELPAEVDLGLETPGRTGEEFGLNGELLLPDVDRIETAHGRALRLAHQPRLTLR